MKVCDKYDHIGGFKILNETKLLEREIDEILNLDELKFGISKPIKIKHSVSERFNYHGWADKVRIGSSRLTISFLKSKVGVCFQIGNVARTYADVLKLKHLYDQDIIEVGVVIVPYQIESKKMGANYAKYDRLIGELELFKNIINMPIAVFALSN